MKPTAGFVVYSEDPSEAKQAGREALPTHFLVQVTYRGGLSKKFYANLENVQANPKTYFLQVSLGGPTDEQKQVLRIIKAVSKLE